MRSLILATILAILPLPAAASSEPYIPASPETSLLEVTPSTDPTTRRIAELRRQLTTDPKDTATAAALAQIYVATARAQNDPRYWGYAEAVLRPWAEASDLVPELLLLRSTVRQNAHDFSAARQDLDVLLTDNPMHHQARLSRAFIHQALGDPAQGMEDCNALRGARPVLVLATCQARMMSLMGEAELALDLLGRALDNSVPREDPTLIHWALAIQADTARRLGRLELAEGHWRRILATAPDNSRALQGLADCLLLQDRPLAVLELQGDGLDVRRLLARQRLGHGSEAELARLAQKFSTTHPTDGPRDLRNETLFALTTGDDPALTLDLARANWATHQEPDDARLLLRAAIAAGDREQVSNVADWVRSRGLEDSEIERMLGDEV
ncbi:MAG: hypothetical protein AAFY56_03225 [Pseudomonadota bacterium]